MVFKVPASKKSQKQNVFEFQISDGGKVYALPLAQFLPPRLTLGLGAGQEQATQVIRGIFDEYAPGSLDEFEDTEQFNATAQAWQDESTATPGESGASSGS